MVSILRTSWGSKVPQVPWLSMRIMVKTIAGRFAPKLGTTLLIWMKKLRP